MAVIADAIAAAMAEVQQAKRDLAAATQVVSNRTTALKNAQVAEAQAAQTLGQKRQALKDLVENV